MGAVKPDIGWNGFSVLHTAAARVAGLDLGLVPGKGGRDVEAILDGAEKGEIDVVYLLGADEIDTERLGKAFVIYQGSHGDRGAHRADVILPGAAYTEKDATYVNTEGRPQMTARAVFPPGEAREDWKIVRALSAVLGQALPFNTAAELRAKMFAACPHLAMLEPDPSRRQRRNRDARGARRQDRQGALRRGDHRFLSDQPDRARIRDHGELERDARDEDEGGDRHRWLSSGRAMACRSPSSSGRACFCSSSC